MRFRELLESTSVPTIVAVCFGRWNPPHKGHKQVWETAAEFRHWYVGTNQSTQGPNDPLPYDVKIKCMAAIYPEIQGHVVPEKNLFTLAVKLYEKYGDNVALKVCTDELWLADGLTKYNGKEAAHGYYKFASIDHVATPRLSSATALRNAVRSNDPVSFSSAAGVPADTPIEIDGKTVKFFDIIAHYLKEFPEKAKK
jgi:hypothetical protein